MQNNLGYSQNINVLSYAIISHQYAVSTLETLHNIHNTVHTQIRETWQ